MPGLYFSSLLMRTCSLRFFLAAVSVCLVLAPPPPTPNHRSVLILGGGVAGIIAARTLHEQGIDDFLIVEARNELGGRLRSKRFGAEGRQVTVELGANWIQGTQEGDGPANPILILARKHGLNATQSDFYESIQTYDETGPVDFMDIFNKAGDAFTDLTIAGGARVQRNQVDSSCRTGYSIVDSKPKTLHEMASEYYMFVRAFPLVVSSSNFIRTGNTPKLPNKPPGSPPPGPITSRTLPPQAASPTRTSSPPISAASNTSSMPKPPPSSPRPKPSSMQPSALSRTLRTVWW